MTSIAKWSGSLLFANGWAHYHGPTGDGQFHAHFLHQIVYSRNQNTTVYLADGHNQTGDWLFIKSNIPHRMEQSDQPVDILYIEPALMSDDTSNLTNFEATKIALLNQPTGNYDPRIERALVFIDNSLEDKIYGANIAAQAGLSASHFNALFRKNMGIPLRRYVLWRRLNVAGFAAWNGQSLTEAAHKAGFADSAHFTRTMRETFGVSPTGGLLDLSISTAPGFRPPGVS